MNLRAIEQRLQARHGENRELADMGLANLAVAASLVDRWTPKMRRQWRLPAKRATVTPTLATMAVVAITTAALGPDAGVSIGTVLATLVFLRRLPGGAPRWQGTAR